MAIVVAISLPWLVRAQSGAETAPVILLHPRVATVLQLPDAIAHARVLDRDEIRLAILGDKLYVRPRPGTAAGLEVLLEVETRTTRWTFQLRVVARASDASREIRVLPVEARASEESTPEPPPEAPAEPVVPPEVPAEPLAPPPAVTSEAGPAASASTSAASPAPPEPEPTDARAAERAPLAASLPRLDLSVHAVAGLGVTALDLPGWDPTSGRQAHRALSMRVAGTPRGTWWALETDVSAEWSPGAMEYEPRGQDESEMSRLAVNGPWLRAEVGLRARLETESELIPSAFVRIGLQAHLRHAQTAGDRPEGAVETMPYGATLAMGIGVQYQVHDLVLGLDFQARRGGPDDYFSVAALWTVGYVLGQGDEP